MNLLYDNLFSIYNNDTDDVIVAEWGKIARRPLKNNEHFALNFIKIIIMANGCRVERFLPAISSSRFKSLLKSSAKNSKEVLIKQDDIIFNENIKDYLMDILNMDRNSRVKLSFYDGEKKDTITDVKTNIVKRYCQVVVISDDFDFLSNNSKLPDENPIYIDDVISIKSYYDGNSVEWAKAIVNYVNKDTNKSKITANDIWNFKY